MTVPFRLGICRPDRPWPGVAAIDARVVQHELERRLGSITLDLRIDGDRIGPWLPVALASWPADVDHAIDADELWNDALPPLASLFARTVDPAAAEVRTRMLAHLGLLTDVVDRSTVDALAHLPIRPTDLWLIARHAERIELDDDSIVALAAPPDAEPLDRAFDTIAARLGPAPEHEAEIARLRAAADSSQQRADDLADELRRAQREAADRFDELAGEARVLRERLDRREAGDADAS